MVLRARDLVTRVSHCIRLVLNLFIRGRITFKTMAFIVDQKVVDVLNKSF